MLNQSCCFFCFPIFKKYIPKLEEEEEEEEEEEAGDVSGKATQDFQTKGMGVKILFKKNTKSLRI